MDTVSSGQELADRLYDEWKAVIGEAPHPWLELIPERWRSVDRLDPELADYLVESEHMGAVLKHPLVFGVPYFAAENPIYNYNLHKKREFLARYVTERDLSGYVYAHERPYRLNALEDIIAELDPTAQEVWDTAQVVWIDSENIFQNEFEWRAIFENWEGDHQESFMTEADRAEWAMLPDDQPITVYRGFSVDGREEGMSWTTDRIRAKWFAKRFAVSIGKPRLAVGRVYKADCVGYLNGRSESEVVLLPENVDIIRVGEVKT